MIAGLGQRISPIALRLAVLYRPVVEDRDENQAYGVPEDAGRRGPAIVVAFCVVVAAVALAFYIYSTGGWQPDEPVPVEVQDKPASPGDGDVEKDDGTPSDNLDDGAQTEIGAVPDQTVEEGINQVRVRPDGSTVVAGLAPPGSAVTLKDGESVIGSATADGRGQWAIVPDKALEPGSHLLSVDINPPEEEARVGGLAAVVEIDEDKKGKPLVALVPYTAEDAPVTVLQAPDDDTGQLAGAGPPAVNIRSVQAVDQGARIQVGGDARGGSTVILGVNGAASDPVAVSGGAYQAEAGIDPDAERFDLEISLMGRDGNRVASAKLRLARSQIEQVLGERSLVVIQKGDALWRIAYRTYGRGIRYVDIYRRNAHQISDPDLIYPDQVFILPRQ